MVSVTSRAAVLAGLALVGSIGTAASVELITTQEAALPDGVNADLNLRGVTRGPKVVVISPAQNAGTVRSPLNLLLKFQAHGRAVIEPHLVKVIYLKKPSVNLTPRIGHLIKADGIEVNNAEVPAGTHHIRVEVKDNAGRVGATTFALMVAN